MLAVILTKNYQKLIYVFSPNRVSRFYMAIGQLQIFLKSYAHRLAIENFLWVLKTLLNHPTLRNALLIFFHGWFQISPVHKTKILSNNCGNRLICCSLGHITTKKFLKLQLQPEPPPPPCHAHFFINF